MSLFLKLIWAHLFILIINKGKGLTQGLDDTTLTEDTQYSINFSRPNSKLCLNLHYNGSYSFLFVNATKMYHFKARNFKIKKYSLCLENISKDFTANNMKKTGLYGYVYVYVGYNIIAVDDIGRW